MLPRKAPKRQSRSGPYRKPTQVGEESILRCSSESWLRNSANLPRNLGIRGPPGGGAEKWLRRLFNKNIWLC